MDWPVALLSGQPACCCSFGHLDRKCVTIDLDRDVRGVGPVPFRWENGCPSIREPGILLAAVDRPGTPVGFPPSVRLVTGEGSNSGHVGPF